MKRLAILAILLALLPTVAFARDWTDMGITAPQMAQYFQQHAGPQDIARVDHPSDIGLISGITVGRKMVIFKSVSEIETFMRSNANSLDIIGYNLEAGQTHSAAELANPVAAAKAAKAVATQYGKLLAIGLTKSLTNQYGPAMVPYADIWILQVQKAQDDPQQVVAWVQPMSKALKQANPNVQIAVQIRTDSQPAALASLVNSMTWLEGVSILTQRSDVQDAVNVAGQFFGGSGRAQTVSQAQPVNFQPVPMAGGSQYGIRVPSKVPGWFAPVASNLIGSNERDHLGRGSVNAWDWSTALRSPVFAIGPGVVNYAGCNDAGHYGCWVQIDHGNGYQSSSAHCMEGSIKVRQGQQVDANTQICSIGRTGWTDWPHVHLVIKKDGVHQEISNFFDTSLVVYCHFTKCQASNAPDAPIAQSGMAVGQQQQVTVATVTTSKGHQLLQALASLPAEQFAMLVSIVVGLLMFFWWLSGTYVRVVILATVTTVIVGGCIALLFMPTQVQATAAGQQPAAIGGDWVRSYEITQGREGWKCTHDPVRTMGGVTQGTYTRWLAKHSMGNADVCSSLTKEQAKQIFYELFWLPVGADKMPMALAITVVDHYYNTGSVSRLLAQCGQDVRCFNSARIADYKSKGNCAAYCTAWINRVNHIRTLTEGN